MKSNSATHICKICFKEIAPEGFAYFISDAVCVCRKCFEEMAPQYIRYKTMGVPCLSLYWYDQTIQGNLYRYKGCADIELAEAFISYMAPLLRIYYGARYMVYPPSSESHIKERGFDHVPLMFKPLDMRVLHVFRKNRGHKQSDQDAEKRKEVSSVIEWIYGGDLAGEKVLLVDDVFTTGSTIKACISLLRKHGVDDIKVLTMSKTRDLDERG